MNKTPRIGFVTSSFPRYEGDTAGSFVFAAAEAFRLLDMEVEVVVPEPPDRPAWGKGEAWLRGIRVIPVPYARPRSAERLFFGAGAPDNLEKNPLRAVLIPAAFFQMTRIAASAVKNWDAVVSHWLVPGAFATAFACRLASKRNIPHLAIAHSGDIHMLSKPLFRPLARAASRTASALGFVSSGARRRFFDILGPQEAQGVAPMTHITPMGIDIDGLVPSRPRAQTRERFGLSGFAVLFLGRMVPIKGLDVLIDALACEPGFELLAAGDGPERTAFERRAEMRGINARFTGAVDAELRAELFRACDVLVLPSVTLANNRCEGLPIVLVEAMAAGIPVVASDTGSVKELVTHKETGLLFKEKDKAALLRCLKQLRDDPVLCRNLARRAKAAAAKRDRRAVIRQILPLLFG